MRKVVLFVAAFVVGIAALIVTVLWYITVYQAGNSSITGMMGQMMGNQQSSNTGIHTMPQYVWGLITVLVVIAALGVAGIAYYLIYPEIRNSPAMPSTPSFAHLPSDSSLAVKAETVSENVAKKAKSDETAVSQTVSWPVLIRTSKPEERKVLEVLAAHGGKYLQKFVVKESGLSKLKTHRIVSRFAERGIITVTKSGNTNEIILADWLQL